MIVDRSAERRFEPLQGAVHHAARSVEQTDERLEEARATLAEKGKEGDFDRVRLETLDEELCVQMLDVGPYDAEQETVDRMMVFARDRGLESHLWHHEVYLSDPRRVPPERLRTILRQPVTR